MNFKKLMKKERKLWHSHFIPSFLAGLLVAIISFVFEMTLSNIILFASVGASAIILTNTKSHHLTRLHTTLTAYVIAIIISILVYFFNTIILLHISINIFLLVFLIGLTLYMFNTFHPPVITASISFIVLERPLVELLYLFIAVLVLLVMVRFLTYTVSQHLPVKDFMSEFKRSM